ncbi:caspase b-like [Thunnus thynnus]|uniref:caspase b-like n=1 Tax=Thunnus thynnus TaxID=8237 RepID=UPI00352869B8
MATNKDLLSTLENLDNDELNQFKWHLQDEDVLEKYEPIKKGPLDGACRTRIVQLMVQNYSREAPEVAVLILREMKRNDLADELEDLANADLEDLANADPDPGSD